MKEWKIEDNLNSVIVDGRLKDNPLLKRDGSVCFTVISRRYYTESVNDDSEADDVKLEKNYIPVMLSGDNLVKSFQKYDPKKGTLVRVVGRLRFPETGEPLVIPEHVEYRKENEN